MSQKRISSGVVHEVPADLKKALSRAAKIKLRRSRFSVITNVHCSSRFEAPTA